jgi:hypothetical protein
MRTWHLLDDNSLEMQENDTAAALPGHVIPVGIGGLEMGCFTATNLITKVRNTPAYADIRRDWRGLPAGRCIISNMVHLRLQVRCITTQSLPGSRRYRHLEARTHLQNALV